MEEGLAEVITKGALDREGRCEAEGGGGVEEDVWEGVVSGSRGPAESRKEGKKEEREGKRREGRKRYREEMMWGSKAVEEADARREGGREKEREGMRI